jgi:DNA-binding SARP family transcriptional activator
LAPAPKIEIIYEKIESKDVNETEKKLKEKERRLFETVKEEILAYVGKCWKAECERIDKLNEAELKAK